MTGKRVHFRGVLLPLALVAPQLGVTLIFFFWPASQAILQSLRQEDAFGLGSRFVGLANFTALWNDPYYVESFLVTAVFSFGVAALSLVVALVLAVAVDRVTHAATAYVTLIVWPYAVAPALAGVLWWFMLNPTTGIVAFGLSGIGIEWNHLLDGRQALLLVMLAAAWKQVSYNFIFFLAGLQSIPGSLIEAAAIDGAGPAKRFFSIVLPLLSPTVFFLVVVNIVYAFFDTFGIIHATTEGGPGQATTTLVYKVFRDGFIGLDLGSSAAQSVVLIVIVVALTVLQFRYVERRVHY